MGSQTKNTLCLAKGDTAYLSPVRADLNLLEDFLVFQQGVRQFLRQRPAIIAYDLHPQYQSTQYALGLKPAVFKFEPVQHHHAHIAACMAEQGLPNQKIIGVAFDGTGLGEDGFLWGGEFLLCDYLGYERVAHLREIPLLGAEMAVREPWRVAAAWLDLACEDEFWKLKTGSLRCWDKKKWRVLKQMHLAGYNSPLASSMGRLFDAAASLILGERRAAFEAELAIKLEKLASSSRLQASGKKLRLQAYPFRIVPKEKLHILDPLPLFKQIAADLSAQVPKEDIAYKFHLTVAQMLKRACLLLRKKYGLSQAVLSGGVFQNKLLLRLGLDLLYSAGFKVISSKEIPCSDAGISLGQAVIAGVRSNSCA